MRAFAATPHQLRQSRIVDPPPQPRAVDGLRRHLKVPAKPRLWTGHRQSLPAVQQVAQKKSAPAGWTTRSAGWRGQHRHPLSEDSAPDKLLEPGHGADSSQLREPVDRN